MRKLGHKAFSFLTAAILAVSICPLTAFALEPADGTHISIQGVSKARYYTGETASLILTAANTSSEDITDVTVSLSGFSTGGLMLNGSYQVEFHYDGIQKSSSESITVPVRASGLAGSGAITADIRYTLGGAEYINKAIRINYQIVEPDIPPDPVEPGKPVIAPLYVEAFRSTAASIVSGQTVTFDYVIANPTIFMTSSKVILTITADGNILVPTGESNTAVLAAVSSGKPAEGSMSFHVKAGLETQMCDIYIKMEYTDYNGDIQSVTTVRSVKITGGSGGAAPNIELSGFAAEGGTIAPGRSFTASLDFKNTGGEEFSSVVLSVEGLSAAAISPVGEGGVYTRGALAPGASDKAVFSLYAAPELASGVREISISVVYTTRSGIQGSFTKTFFLTVTAAETKTGADLKLIGAEAKDAAAGGRTALVLTIENRGGGEAKSTELTLTGLSPDGAVIDGVFDTFELGAFKPGEKKTLSIPLILGSGVSGYLALGVTFKADGLPGDSQSISLPVAAAPAQNTALEIEGFNTGGAVKAGESFTFKFTLKNAGNTRLTNLRISFTGTGFIPKSGLNLISHESLEPGQTVTKSVELTAAAGLAEGMSPVDMRITHSGGESNVSVYVQVDGTAATENPQSIPRVIIESYTIDPENVEAGSVFIYTFNLKNTSRTLPISNIKVTLSSADGVFSPVSGGNTFYTEIIQPQAVETYTAELTAKSSAEQKSYPLTVQIEYEYGTSGTYNGAEQMNIYVSQPIRLEFSNVSIPVESYGYGGIYIYFPYYNKGKSALNNLTISVEGDFTMEDGEMFLGSFPAGSGTQLETMLYPMGTGFLTGALVFSFEDAAGNPVRREIPLEINVIEESYTEPFPPIEGKPGEEFPGEEFPGESGDSVLAWYWLAAIIAGGLAVAVTVVIIAVKAVKKKRVPAAEDTAEIW